ncbi:hypothetical protein WJ0W_006272 [Paenibacillus melissococcoides]|uniref:Uncharacterized protein n=1 Tax=Paenibacillus melissococcoides TaxID=2912268 RepID=A0ABM9GCX1_9BACL|nr:hypothetical protein [Paenibacillus dendritiformis]CAH8249085.1 hypothetical protein WJ0W_006272 [Paenibacillus melissococcoides]
MSSAKRSVVPTSRALSIRGSPAHSPLPAARPASSSIASMPPSDHPATCHGPSGSCRRGARTASRRSSAVSHPAKDT